MTAGKKLMFTVASALAAGAALTGPAAAPAHETGEHTPTTANCPAGGPTQNAVCFALRGMEYSLRHGGTQQAGEEWRARTEANSNNYKNAVSGAVEDYSDTLGDEAALYRTTMVSAGVSFASGVELATTDLHLAFDAGIVNGLIGSDTYAADGVTALQSFLESPDAVPCPLNNDTTPVFPQTVGALRTLFCAQWAAVVALPNDTTDLVEHLNRAEPTLRGLSNPFADAMMSFGRALDRNNARLATDTTQGTDAFREATGAATTATAEVSQAATEALGANQVFDTFYAAQCVRKGDYGNFARPTPCPQ